MTTHPPTTLPAMPRLLVLLSICLIGLISVSVPAAAAEEIHVRYRSAETVYLDNGTAAGLEVGQRLEVVRGGEVIGLVEVIYTATRSASTKVIEESRPIAADDLVRRPGETTGSETGVDPEIEAAMAATAAAVAAESAAEAPAAGTANRQAELEGSYSTPAVLRARRQRTSGSFTLDYENFSDGSDEGDFGFSRLTGRLSLRMRNIAGSAFQLRLRARSSSLDRDREPGADVPSSETRNRFYELSLLYDNPEKRYTYRIGRLGSSPFAGVGYLDGVLGHYELSRSFALGGFFGGRSDVTEIGIETGGLKYGVYARFRNGGSAARRPFELYLAGVREDGDEVVNREYLAMETRWDGGNVWSFYQRAELDLNRDWREEASDSATQLSNFSLATTARISDSSRFVFSYNLYQRYRTEETRFIADELFNQLLRQGLRVSYRYNSPRGIAWSVDGGLRDQEGETEQAYYFGGSVRHNNVANRRFSLGGNVLAFSNPSTEGFLLRFRVGKRFLAGHSVDLDFGGRMSQHKLYDDQDDTAYQWVRLGGWIELPKRFFTRAEIELTFGDELQGQRLTVGLGYRF